MEKFNILNQPNPFPDFLKIREESHQAFLKLVNFQGDTASEDFNLIQQEFDEIEVKKVMLKRQIKAQTRTMEFEIAILILPLLMAGVDVKEALTRTPRVTELLDALRARGTIVLVSDIEGNGSRK